MFILIFINILFLIILVFFISINVLNLIKMPRLEQYSEPSAYPSVSIIVPARNEAKNIAYCAGSLLAQDYPEFELIIVNDNSTDETAQILKELQSKHPRLKVIDGLPLPVDWAGKNWAVHQGYTVSKGEILIFTDADTFHERDTVKKAVAALKQKNADFLTALPAQHTRSFGEKVVIPKVFWLVYSLFPFAYLDKFPFPASAFGIGQFMMYRRTTYQASGGYEAIKNVIVDDMTMARQIKKQGFRSLVTDGSSFISCRMYTNWREIYNGFARTIYPLISHSLPRWLVAPLYTLGIAFLGLTFFTPILTIFSCLALLLSGITVSIMLWLLAGLGIIFSFITYSLVYLRFKFPIYMIILYPFNVLAFQVIAYGSLFLAHLGKIVWKERYMSDPS